MGLGGWRNIPQLSSFPVCEEAFLSASPRRKSRRWSFPRAPRGEVRHAERDTRAIETDGHDGMVGAFHHAEVKSLASTSDSGPSQKCRPMLGGTR